MQNIKAKIRAVFAGAFEHETDEALQQYLARACGDDAQMRQEVEELLRSHRDAGSFLGGTSPTAGIDSDEMQVDLVGTTLGPYKLLEVLGEGGMGTVYMAQQTEPVKRRVAIKLIKLGMDSRQVMARFEAERQALALMDHPNIAKVLDAGTSESGRLYFVMELVKGRPITEFCNSHRMDTNARLKLFQKVCHAVQHAHQKGIIHRDIKPSNVMVAMYDDRPVPKVIDFGVAKATGEELTEKTMFTRFGQIVGTLEYMSPEQAQFNQLDIDTRSDVYSLGAILYELIAGEPPFERERLRSQALDETLRMIREDEPTKPSTKLRSAECAAQTAADRGTSIEKLNSIVRGDLDWIVMKSLDKDRSRRYATANEVAAEIDRYLNNLPVNAGQPSALYRFKKFARRNKTGFVFGTAISAALILGMIGTSWQAIRATKEENRAERQTSIAEAVETFWNEDVLLQADPYRQTSNVNPEIRLREVFDLAAAKIEGKFADDPEVAVEIYKVLSRGYNNLSHYEGAIELVSREIDLREREFGTDYATVIDARSRLGLFLMNDGQLDRAIVVLEHELNRCRDLLPANDKITMETLSKLGRAYLANKDYTGAIDLLNEALELETGNREVEDSRIALTHTVLGTAYSAADRDADADRHFEQALLIIKNSSATSRRYVEVQVNYGIGRHHLNRMRFSEAEIHLAKAWAIAKTNMGLGHLTTIRVGKHYSDCLGALRRLEIQRRILEELGAAQPQDLDLKINLAGNLCNSGIMAQIDGKPAKGIENGDRALEILNAVLKRDPENSKAISFRINTWNLLGQSLAAAQEYDQSVEKFQRAIEDLESQVRARPDDSDKVSYLANLNRQCGDSLRKLNQLEEALKNYKQASELVAARLKTNPGSDPRELVELLDTMISIYMRAQKAADAVRVMDQLANVPGVKISRQKETLRELIRAYVYAADKKHTEAVEIADRYWLEEKEENNVLPVVWTWAASTYAISAKVVANDEAIPKSTRVALADKYGKRAVSVLREVLSSDDFSSSRAKKGLLNQDDYSSLRHRTDFQVLFRDE